MQIPPQVPQLHGIQPHIKTDTAPPKSTHSNCLLSRTIPSTLFHRHSGAKRRLYAYSTSWSLCQKCRRHSKPGANDYILVLLNLARLQPMSLPHRYISVNEYLVSVMNNSIHYRLGDWTVILRIRVNPLVPAFSLKLRTEDSRPMLCPRFDDLKQVVGLFRSKTSSLLFIQALCCLCAVLVGVFGQLANLSKRKKVIKLIHGWQRSDCMKKKLIIGICIFLADLVPTPSSPPIAP